MLTYVVRIAGHEFAFVTQAEVGDLDFKWLRDYGPTWRIGGNLGVSMSETFRALKVTLNVSRRTF